MSPTVEETEAMDAKVTLRGCLFGLLGAALMLGALVFFLHFQGENATRSTTALGMGIFVLGVICLCQVIWSGQLTYGCTCCGKLLYVTDPNFTGFLSCPSCRALTYICECGSPLWTAEKDEWEDFASHTCHKCERTYHQILCECRYPLHFGEAISGHTRCPSCGRRTYVCACGQLVEADRMDADTVYSCPACHAEIVGAAPA